MKISGLKHCGKWKDAIPRPPPQISAEPATVAEEVRFRIESIVSNSAPFTHANSVQTIFLKAKHFNAVSFKAITTESAVIVIIYYMR